MARAIGGSHPVGGKDYKGGPAHKHKAHPKGPDYNGAHTTTPGRQDQAGDIGTQARSKAGAPPGHHFKGA